MSNSITHAVVVERFVQENYPDNPKAAKEFRSNCKAWCLRVGSSLDAPAEDTLGSSYPSRLKNFLELLNRTNPGKARAGKNVRTAAAKMQATYEAMLASQDLPTDFNAAFRLAMDAKGIQPIQLIRILYERYFRAERKNWYGSQIYGFYNGTAGPGKSWRGDSKLLLQRCEVVLGLDPDTLVSRAYRTVKPVALGTFTGIPYRQARSDQWASTYALRHLPPRIESIFKDYTAHRHQREHLIDGQYVLVEARSLWTRPATQLKHKKEYQRFFGWLCLPSSEKAPNQLTDQQRWGTGMGLRPQDLRMAHMFDLRLVGGFLEFLRFRQHNHVFTKSHVAFLEQINSWVSMPYSFLTMHPELADDFGLVNSGSLADWRALTEELHQAVLKLMRSVRRMAETGQRSADEPLKHVMAHQAPYALFLTMLQRLEEAPPLRANTQTWSVWARDVAMLRMESEVPLRPRNIAELTLERNVKRDPQTGLWRVFIPKSDLKNFYSGHAEDINRQYSEVTSQALDRYVNEARCHLTGATESDWLFLGPASGRRSNQQYVASVGHQLSTDSIHRVSTKHLTTYFGEAQGITIFRHVITTSILKDDATQVDAAAAVLNNSPNTVRANYKHLTQSDGLRHAATWFRRQRSTDES